MKTESGRASRSSLLFLAGLVAVLTCFPAMPLFAVGGDNDSPYNMPDRGGEGDSSNSNGGGWQSGNVVVSLAPGAQLVAASLSSASARVGLGNVGQITTVGSGGVTVNSTEATRIHILAGEQVWLERNGPSVGLQGGQFVVQSRGRVLLIPSTEFGHKRAFLLVGEPGAEGSPVGALARVDFITGLAFDGSLGSGGIDLAGLAEELAARAELDGKAALVVLVNATSSSQGHPARMTVEAFAGFRIMASPAIRIRIPGF